ncbi:hypothetical protein CFR75_15995 [Komagataeibacter xylinus]|uniref:Insertion element IS402-like domain-containing protein n=1 Tax=Komagataeibacter xylinus TaxID=28448 RepID=A0A318PE79_KOMXY|nr:hypothetical protein CFR75_15995 [Komagataeibacter xylinus]
MGTATDNHLFVEAVLYRYRAGIPWRDLPVRFGDWKNVHRRLRRWCESGVIERIFRHLAADRANEYMMIDSKIVRAHQHSAGARKKRARTRPSGGPVADQLRKSTPLSMRQERQSPCP